VNTKLKPRLVVEMERGYSEGKDTEVNKKGKYKQEKR